MNTDTHHTPGRSPTDDPVQMLTGEHNTVRKLVEAYQKGHSAVVRQEAATEMMTLLEMHSRLEETVFYPAVRSVDGALIGHFEQEHHKTDDLVQSLKGMAVDDPQAERMLGELIDMTMRHIEQEENELFPKLRQAKIDMATLGAQMQTFEANLVHMQTQVSRPGARS